MSKYRDAHNKSNFQHTLTQTLEKAMNEVNGSMGSIVLVDPMYEELVIAAKIDPDGTWPPPPDQKVRLKFKVGEGIAGSVAKTGEARYIPFANEDPIFVPSIEERRSDGDWSMIVVPILDENKGTHRTIGVISIEGPKGKPNFFDDKALQSVQKLATDAVSSIIEAMWPALIHSTLSTYRLQRIQAVSQVLVSHHDLSQILEQIARIAFEELQVDLLTLYRWDEIKQDFVTPPIQLGEFLVPEAMISSIHEGDAVYNAFYEWGSRFFSEEEMGRLLELGRVPAREGMPARDRFPIREKIKSAAILRLEIGQKKVGVLCVNWRRSHVFDESERAVLEIFANHVAVAIENDRIEKDRRTRQAIKEAMTAQRMKLHRELHEWIGGDLTAMATNIATCKNYLQQNKLTQVYKFLEQTEIARDRAAKTIKGLIAERRYLKFNDVNELEKQLEHFCIEEQEALECSITLSVENHIEQNEKLRKELLENTYHIAHEAIRNARRHANPSYINVSLSISQETLHLSVINDGVSSDDYLASKNKDNDHFGIDIMKTIADIMGGQIDIRSKQASQEWQVILNVPSPIS